MALGPIIVLIAGALIMPTGSLAAESTTGYSQTVPTPPKTSTTPPPTTPTTGTSPSKTSSTPTAPSTGTSPSKEKSTPEGTSPSKEPSTPTSTTSAGKAATLPFTGFDLRLTVGIGLLLVALGFSIVTVQRRHRRSGG